jgi:hypothetical protein
MTDKAISPLRRRMIEDMMIRKPHRRPNMTTCKGSRTSPRFSAARPPLPARKMCGATSCIWHRTARARPAEMDESKHAPAA